MSRHWNPDDEIARLRPESDGAHKQRSWPESYSVQKRRSWPPGATAGVVLVAAACLSVAAILYHVAGPRDTFEQER